MSNILDVSGYAFQFVCLINPEKGLDGKILTLLPQSRYKKSATLSLNKYGRGPFCKFRIPGNIRVCGVYALVVRGSVRYVGECENLSTRFNMGYGNISPRNCYVGGQETNCRINTLIFEHSSTGSDIALWFHETNDYKALETQLRKSISLEWNRI